MPLYLQGFWLILCLRSGNGSGNRSGNRGVAFTAHLLRINPSSNLYQQRIFEADSCNTFVSYG